MKTTLDRIDFDILALLQKDARLSNKELAVSVGLAQSTCLLRIQRLRQLGFLGTAHAEVSPEAVGVGLQALVAVRLRQHRRPQVQAFWAHVNRLPEVLAAYHLTGAHDFLLHVAVRDARYLRDFAMDALSTRPEVEHLETSLIVDFARNPVLPVFAQPGDPIMTAGTRGDEAVGGPDKGAKVGRKVSKRGGKAAR